MTEMASHVAVWVGSAIAYKAGNTGSDLWGWTCSDGADGIQEVFKAVINFDDFCKVQVGCGRKPQSVMAWEWLTVRTADVCVVRQHRAGCVGDSDDNGVCLDVSADKAQGEDEEPFGGVSGELLSCLCGY